MTLVTCRSSAEISVIAWLLSLVMHACIIISFLPVFDFFAKAQAEQLSVIRDQAVIEISLVPDFIAHKPIYNRVETKTLDDRQTEEEDAKGEFVVPTPALRNAEKANKVVSPEPERYEQILARHFANAMPEGVDKIRSSGIIYMWIKINRLGEIVDHRFIPDAPNNEIKLILEAVSRNVRTVPLPAESELNWEYAQYAIPLIMNK